MTVYKSCLSIAAKRAALCRAESYYRRQAQVPIAGFFSGQKLDTNVKLLLCNEYNNYLTDLNNFSTLERNNNQRNIYFNTVCQQGHKRKLQDITLYKIYGRLTYKPFTDYFIELSIKYSLSLICRRICIISKCLNS